MKKQLRDLFAFFNTIGYNAHIYCVEKKELLEPIKQDSMSKRHGDIIVIATIVEIFTTDTSGSALRAVEEAVLETGRGLVGDRYYTGRGTFSEKLQGKPDAEITLIESEEIDRFNEAEKSAKTAGEFRRNIVTKGVRLNALIGRRFKVGAAELEGIRLCEPCAHLAKLVSVTIVESMMHRAGLRARVVLGATIRRGDAVVVNDAV